MFRADVFLRVLLVVSLSNHIRTYSSNFQSRNKSHTHAQKRPRLRGRSHFGEANARESASWRTESRRTVFLHRENTFKLGLCRILRHHSCLDPLSAFKN